MLLDMVSCWSFFRKIPGMTMVLIDGSLSLFTRGSFGSSLGSSWDYGWLFGFGRIYGVGIFLLR